MYKKTDESTNKSQTMEKINKFNLEEICNLLNLLRKCEDLPNITIDTITIGDKTYRLGVENSVLSIECSDGRKMVVNTNEYSTEIINFIYGFPDGNLLRFISRNNCSQIEVDRDKNIYPLDILPYLDIECLTKNDNLFFPLSSSYCEPGWDFDYFSTNYGIIEIRDNNIIYEGDCLISPDGKTLLSIDGVRVPSIYKAKRLISSKPQRRLNAFLKSGSPMHPYTREILTDSLDRLEKIEKILKEIIKFYDTIIPMCEDIVCIREDINEKLNDCIFSKEELSLFTNIFTQEIEKSFIEPNKKTNKK